MEESYGKVNECGKYIARLCGPCEGGRPGINDLIWGVRDSSEAHEEWKAIGTTGVFVEMLRAGRKGCLESLTSKISFQMTGFWAHWYQFIKKKVTP